MKKEWLNIAKAFLNQFFRLKTHSSFCSLLYACVEIQSCFLKPNSLKFALNLFGERFSSMWFMWLEVRWNILLEDE